MVDEVVRYDPLPNICLVLDGASSYLVKQLRILRPYHTSSLPRVATLSTMRTKVARSPGLYLSKEYLFPSQGFNWIDVDCSHGASITFLDKELAGCPARKETGHIHIRLLLVILRRVAVAPSVRMMSSPSITIAPRSHRGEIIPDDNPANR
jgi:hypothetical protein